jgi:hypothetical protein
MPNILKGRPSRPGVRHMPRIIAVLLLSLAVLAAGCGDDKKPAPETSGERQPATEAAAPTSTPEPEPTATEASDEGGDADDSVISALLGNALSGASGGFGGAGLSGGDESLKAYLLQQGDLPAGYTSFGEFTFRMEEGLSEYGGADMAASMAASGDFASDDPTSFGMLMSMVMRFDDLQDLESAFGDLEGLTEEDLEESIGPYAEALPFAFSDISLLDVSGLGDNAMGISMTFDLGGLAEIFGGAPAGEDVPDAITMHMYFFGRGQYAGALLRMGTGATLPADVDELALARLIDERLASAP